MTWLWIFLHVIAIDYSEKKLEMFLEWWFSVYGHLSWGVHPWERCFSENGTDHRNTSGAHKCCPIFENDGFLLSVMKMWVTQCIFLHSSTFYHVNLGKSQFSCLDMRFTKVGTKFVKKVFKLDVDIFHQKQPNCKLDSYERTTKKENSTISSWDWWRYRSEAMSPVAC